VLDLSAPTDNDAPVHRSANNIGVLSTPNPQMFGAIGRGDDVDESTELQRYFDWLKDNAIPRFDLIGDFSTSKALVLDSNHAARFITGSIIIRALTAIDRVLTLRNLTAANIPASIEVRGTGRNSHWDSWTCRTGIFLDRVPRAKFERLRVRRFYYWGIDTLGADNSNICDLGAIDTYDCGTWSGSDVGNLAPGHVTFTWTLHGSLKNSGQNDQGSKITIDPMHPGFEAGQNVQIGGELYLVREINEDDGSLFIFPWLDDSLGETGTGDFIIGGGIRLIGSDTGEFKIDMLDAIRCGVGYGAHSLYGASINRFVSQYTYIGYQISTILNAAHIGENFSYFYAEGNVWDIVKNTYTDNNSVNISSSIGLDLTKCWSMTPRITGGTYSTRNMALFGEEIRLLDRSYRALQSPRNNRSSVQRVRLKSAPEMLHFDDRGSGLWYLTIGVGEFPDGEAINRLFGYSGVQFTITGDDVLATQTFEPEPKEAAEHKWTVMGQDSYVFEPTKEGVLVTAIANMNSRDWRIQIHEQDN